MSAKSCFYGTVKTVAVAASWLFVVVLLYDTFREKDGAAAEARETQITAELASLDRAQLTDDDWAKHWAGVYYTGAARGRYVSISIAPKSGVAYVWRGCCEVLDSNYGEIAEILPGGIKAKLAMDPANGRYGFMDSTLFFVQWGDRRFLVPECLMPELVDNYNLGGEQREQMPGIPMLSSSIGVRDTERPGPCPPGRPQLPAEYAKLIVE